MDFLILAHGEIIFRLEPTELLVAEFIRLERPDRFAATRDKKMHTRSKNPWFRRDPVDLEQVLEIEPFNAAAAFHLATVREQKGSGNAAELFLKALE